MECRSSDGLERLEQDNRKRSIVLNEAGWPLTESGPAFPPRTLPGQCNQ